MLGFVYINKSLKTFWQVLKGSVHLKRAKWRQLVVCMCVCVCVVMYLIIAIWRNFVFTFLCKPGCKKNLRSHFFLMNALNQGNSGQSKVFYVKTQDSCSLSLSLKHDPFDSSTSIIDLRVANTGNGTQPWSISWLVSLFLILSLYFFSRSWFLLRSLCPWGITAINVCVRSYNAIHFAWPCVYDMIGICEQVGKWKNIPSDSECCIVWLQHRRQGRFLCSDPRNILLLLFWYQE